MMTFFNTAVCFGALFDHNMPLRLFSRHVFFPSLPIKIFCRHLNILGHRFFIFGLQVFFRNKLVSEDEINIKIKFIRTIFQLN